MKKPKAIAAALILIISIIAAMLAACSVDNDIYENPLGDTDGGSSGTSDTDNPDDTGDRPVIYIPDGQSRVETFGIAYSPSGSLNPITGTSRINNEFMPLVFEGLFKINGQYEAESVLCKSYTYEEYKYTFIIRDDVFFSDGTGLTAEDVRHSLELARSAESNYAGRLETVASIRSADEYVLEITLARDSGRLQTLLDIPIIKKGSEAEDFPVGTGMYMYRETDGEPVLRRSPYYRGTAPYEQIQLVQSPETELLIYSFENGALSIVSNDPTATTPIVYGGDYEQWEYDTSAMYYLGFNTESAPFDSAELRSAIYRVIDRENICEWDMLRHAVPAYSPCQPACDFYRESGAISAGEFEEILLELGIEDTDGDDIREYPQGRRTEIFEADLIVNTENVYKAAVADNIARQLEGFGISVNVRKLSWDAFQTALKSGDFDIYLGEIMLSPDMNIEKLALSWGSLNFGGWQDAETDELVFEFIAAGQDNIKTAAGNLYRRLEQEAPIVPLLFKTNLLLAKRGVITSPEPSQYNLYGGFEGWNK